MENYVMNFGFSKDCPPSLRSKIVGTAILVRGGCANAFRYIIIVGTYSSNSYDYPCWQIELLEEFEKRTVTGKNIVVWKYSNFRRDTDDEPFCIIVPMPLRVIHVGRSNCWNNSENEL
ncbi:hypothetical protein AVEN_171862-1 [Araneus ventricosus]|uniref:Uncharacterized protein n=1 Tax=Araneus ventricosus TaxID=182803 RepID=A0A4Y2IVA5_ARAVE|nr:hypothetical protein AVEN_17941-1 [Araneus ventricosus]GBM80826.1 hypothetical protein AVEN_171862-1 [Araneus ventricosus]